MAKTPPIQEVKARLPELVTGVADREEEIVVTRNGKQVAESRAFYASGKKGLSFEDVFGEPLRPVPKARR